MTMVIPAQDVKGDAYARCRTGSTAGRGSIVGWTSCPLCSQPPSSVQSTSTSSPLFRTSINEDHNLSNAYVLSILSTPQKNNKTVKLFSHGRGLSAHLHAVHTPWNPGKAELKRRKAIYRREENERRRRQLQNIVDSKDESSEHDVQRCRKRAKLVHPDSESRTSALEGKWDPTEKEIICWNQRVMEIVALVESEANKKEKYALSDDKKIDSCTNANKSDSVVSSKLPSPSENNADDTAKGRDRSGKKCPSYRQSLPPFLAAAAIGDLAALQKCTNNKNGSEDNCATVEHAKPQHNLSNNKCQEHIKSLLSLRDRNGSTAEHWAAGGGHLGCLSFLLELRDLVYSISPSETDNSEKKAAELPTKATQTKNNDATDTAKHNKKIRRRRDGKTSLHYAARNGQNACIDLLLSRQDAPPVDIPSGDGTTPLHMACYGGHPSTVKHLIQKHGADVHAVNEWQCGSAHFVAMSLGDEGSEAVIELCNYLKEECDVDFVARQKQGHTPLHKAASRKNQQVIEWVAGKVATTKQESNQHQVSSICTSMFSSEDKKMMGLPDEGGNRPSDIWLSVGGESEFGMWMENACGW